MPVDSDLALLFGIPGYGGGGAALNIGQSFWMEPTSGDKTALALGDATSAAIGGNSASCTHVGGPTYHAGTIGALAFASHASGCWMRYPSLTGPGFNDLSQGWWLGGLFRVASSGTNRGICGNGANTTTEKGFRVLLNNGSVNISISDGVTRPNASFSGMRTFPLNTWISFLWQFKVDIANTKVIARCAFENYGIYNASQSQKEFTGIDMTGVVPFYPGLTIGDTGPTKALPFVGDTVMYGGTLPNNDWISDEIANSLYNHNRSRLYDDMMEFNNRRFVKLPLVGPKQGGLVFAVRCDVPIKAKVYDEATRTLQAETSVTTPTNGFVRFDVDGLADDMPVEVVFENNTGVISHVEWHHRTVPAAGEDMKFGVVGCAEWNGDPSGAPLTATTAPWHLTITQDCDVCLITGDWGYFDPDESAWTTISQMTDAFDQKFLTEKSWRFHCNTLIIANESDHIFEADADSTSDYLSLGQSFQRLRTPAPSFAFSDGWDYAVTVGTYHVIVMDCRASKINNVQMMDATRLGWVEDQIQAAVTSNKIPILMSDPIIRYDPSIPLHTDCWDTYPSDRTAIFDYLATELGTAAKKCILVSGDTHMIGLASISQSQFDTGGALQAPCIGVARMNHSFGETKGSWDHFAGVGTDAWGLIDITDNGATVAAAFKVYISGTQQGTTMSETITVP